jgi:GNAT superfamily N-acetyltransferase
MSRTHPAQVSGSELPAADVDGAFARRVEEASLNAWPALHQLVLDGWLVRFAGGFTKRANSVVPLYGAAAPIGEKIEHCERLYAQQGLRTIFRLTTLSDHSVLDDALAGRGYEAIEPTSVLCRPLDDAALDVGGDRSTPISAVTLDREPWLAIYARLAGMPASSRAPHEALLKNICLPCIYMALCDDTATIPAVPAEATARGAPGTGLDMALDTATRTSTQSATRTDAHFDGSSTSPQAAAAAVDPAARGGNPRRGRAADANAVACALGVVDQGLLGLFDLVTDHQHRGLGHGERVVRAVLDAGRRRGARHAYLQVLDANAAAQRLYARLGFRLLYRYWYRVAA